jgi:protein SCO1/2
MFKPTRPPVAALAPAAPRRLAPAAPRRLAPAAPRRLAPAACAPGRRHALRQLAGALAFGGLASLAACGRPGDASRASGEGPPQASFRGIDLTGASFGRDFRLADPQGRERSLADFRGRVVLLFFGYTQCPDVCPTALLRARAVRERLGPLGDRLQVVFVTVDPERDTAELMAAYTGAFGEGVVGLRGDAEATAAAAREFKVIYAKVPSGSTYTVDHTALSYLFDPQGRLRVALGHGLAVEDFEHDIRQLIDGA